MIIREEAMNTLIDICNNPPEPTDALRQLLQGDDSFNEIKLNRQLLENAYDAFKQADIMMGCKYNYRKCLACGDVADDVTIQGNNVEEVTEFFLDMFSVK